MKRDSFFLLLILLCGFFLRLWTARVIPFIEDERITLDLAREISFSPETFNLPLVAHPRTIDHPILSAYFAKLGFLLFGESDFSGRLIFVILGTLNLYFLYRIVDLFLGRGKAFLAILLMCFCQYHIASSSIATEEIGEIFFTTLSVYFFLLALRTQEKHRFYQMGAAIGVGFLNKESIILIIPVLFLFLMHEKIYRHWLKRKEMYAGFLIGLVIAMPYILWISFNKDYNPFILRKAFDIGISFRSLYLYLGDAFSLLSCYSAHIAWVVIEDTSAVFIRWPHAQWHLISEVFADMPAVNWLTGSLILSSFFYYKSGKNRQNVLIRFALFMFFIIFIITSIVGAKNGLLGCHYYAKSTIIAGFILLSSMLVEFTKVYKHFKVCIVALVIYSAINASYRVYHGTIMFSVPKQLMIKEECIGEKCYYYSNEFNPHMVELFESNIDY